MEVIVLHGVENSGKTKTLNLVYYELLNNGFIQHGNFFRQLGAKEQYDFEDVLIKDNKQIGIITMGDYINAPDGVIHLLRKMESRGCLICICASTSNKPKILVKIQNDYPKAKKKEKEPSASNSEERISNREYAMEIVTELSNFFNLK